jgi:crotonobetainyl-CoA:carnitine CoA-transferase CaiB-like acyl-CoA transferase
MNEVNTAKQTDSGASSGPLAGVRVLDLTSVIMGPLATQIMGDLGADVICIEAAGGDAVRFLGAPTHPQLCGTALNVLRNKRNVSLNLKNPEGLEAFMRIAATCDVVITNLRPRPRERLGITYETIRKIRPNIIFCHAQGWSRASGRADDAAYDDVIQAGGGMADLYVKQGGTPAIAPVAVGDQVSSLTIIYSVLAALYHREKTGEGQNIEVPMVDTMTAFVLAMHGHDAIPQPPLGTPGYQRVLDKLRRPWPTKDGYLQVVLYTKENWADMLAVGGKADTLDDSRLATPQSRNKYYPELYKEMGQMLTTKTTAEWITWCKQRGIGCSKVESLEKLIDDLPIVQHPLAGPYRQTPIPVNFSATPGAFRRPAPLPGEHNVELLMEVGYSRQQITELETSGGVIRGAQKPR